MRASACVRVEKLRERERETVILTQSSSHLATHLDGVPHFPLPLLAF